MVRILLHVALATLASATQIIVSPSGGNATSNKQYGIMFEDINRGGDGGIYAELIQNRAFYHSEVFNATLDPWQPVGGAALSLQNLAQPLSSALTTSLRVSASSGTVGFKNPGFWGISVQAQKYTGSFWVKGAYTGSFTAALVSNITSTVYASVNIASESQENEWIQHNFTLTPSAAAPNVNNTLTITFDSTKATNGYLNFNLISLFPPTWKNRPNGLRVDLMQALNDINPQFLRLPGGSDLEGTVNGTNWNWTTSIGPLRDRPGRPSIWGYQTSNGLGLVEYMEWCDDLGMEPILAVWDGEYLSGVILSEAELIPYVQDTMNELEFLMGPISSKYGAMRAALGHPKPWKINYVEVGNEDNLGGGLPSYQSYRYQMYYKAITAKYPQMSVMASTVMTVPAGSSSDYHQYSTPDAFITQFNWFDQYPVGSQTLIGEVACVYPNTAHLGYVNWTDRSPASFPVHPWWIGTVSEAIFLLGAERNSEKIIGAAFAPTMQNMNDWQWSPDLISFTADPADTTRSTSHHMLQLFANNKMTTTLPSTHDTKFNPLYYVTGMNNKTNTYMFKAAVYNSTAPQQVALTFPGVKSQDLAQLTVLTAPDGYSSNAVGGKNVVKKKVMQLSASTNGSFVFSLPSLSVALLKTLNVNMGHYVEV